MNSSVQLEKESLSILRQALDRLEAGFAALPASGTDSPDLTAVADVLMTVADRLQDNYPYFHPLYAGQMLKPPHPVARLAYALAVWLNPNNHALDGGRASSAMEKEAVAEIAALFGWQNHLGHLCSGGTVANLEALWVARERMKEQGSVGTVLASEQAHYTHGRMCGVLGIPFEAIPCDAKGRLDLTALEKRLAQGDVGAVVATLGTTATGSIDPLPEILALRQRFGFRLHADVAYGGYFTLADNLTAVTRTAYKALTHVDSLVIDPHKHGLQPYGCGCVLFPDPTVGRFYKHSSPYTYFSSAELHLGEISLECSRAGAGAVGLWATQKLLPLVPNGDFAQGLSRSRRAALDLYERVKADGRFLAAFPPELDIVVWAVNAPSVRQASRLARQIFEDAAERHLHLALSDLPTRFFALPAGMEADADSITCLRSVLMKPEHEAWVGQIWGLLDEATTAVLNASSD